MSVDAADHFSLLTSIHEPCTRVRSLQEPWAATPNGRFASAKISYSADPDPNFLPGGGTAPSAKANTEFLKDRLAIMREVLR
jgi:hypothetical protein